MELSQSFKSCCYVAIENHGYKFKKTKMVCQGGMIIFFAEFFSTLSVHKRQKASEELEFVFMEK